MATLREKWIAALRSGEYKQGLRALNSGDGFCCLGVLADVAGCEWGQTEHGFAELIVGGSRLYNVLPNEVLDTDYQGVCWVMNDVERLSFHEIADYIEAHPEIDPVWPAEGE